MIERIPLTDQPERNPGPYEADRHCGVCSAVLSRNNPGPRCAPCQLASMPEAELVLEAMNRVTDAMDITPMPTVEDMYPPAA